MTKTLSESESRKRDSGMAANQDLVSRPDVRAYDDGVRLASSLVKEFQEKLRRARESAKTKTNA